MRSTAYRRRVALQQQRGSSARSSVGSVTTLSSLVRMMYSRAGACNQPARCTPRIFAQRPRGVPDLPRPGPCGLR